MKRLINVKGTKIYGNEDKIVLELKTDLGDEIVMNVVKVVDKWEVIEGEGAKNNLADTYVSMIIDMMISSVEYIVKQPLFRDSDLGPKLATRF